VLDKYTLKRIEKMLPHGDVGLSTSWHIFPKTHFFA